MRIVVDPRVYERFPRLEIAVVRGQGAKVREDTARSLDAFTGQAVDAFLAANPDKAALESRRPIALWRDIYGQLGTNPKKHRPTAEAFALRIVKGSAFFRVCPLVDLYLGCQLHHLLPTGGYDLARIRGDIQLTWAAGGEPFLPIGGAEPEAVEPGEVVYRDSAGVLTRRWNHRDCDRAKLTHDTEDFVLMIEDPATDAHGPMAREAGAQLLAALRAHFQGSFLMTTLDRLHPDEHEQ